nr:SDR family oxidoreductase [Xanthovirga aplysinae]
MIVGGSSGIGLAITEKLQKKGENVFVASRRGESIKNLSGIKHISVDVTNDEVKLEGLPEQLDGLAYCPGTINLKPFRSLRNEDFQKDFEINVLGAVKIIHEIEGSLKKNQSSIVLFSTVAVGQGMPFHASVATSKGAIEGLCRSLAAEFAPKVRVNCIAPSLTETPLSSHLLNSKEKIEHGAKRHPMERIGTSNDIAALAVFLLEGESSWITGQIIGADGGLSSLRK